MSRDHLTLLFKKVFPTGDSEQFCNHIFRVFDDDGSKTLEFSLMCVVSSKFRIVQSKSEKEKESRGQI